MRNTRPMAVEADVHPKSTPDATPLVMLTVTQLERIVQGAVLDALDKHEQGRAPTPELVSGATMAKKLGVSRTKMHRLREEGCPSVRVGDVFKFQPAKVMSWLEARDAG